MLIKALIVGLGGFFGAIARFGVSSWLQGKMGSFPIGTLLVNLVGSLLLSAMLFGVFNPKHLSQEYKLLLMVGFCGSLTTMSTFAMDFFQLSSASQIAHSIGYLLLNVVGCILMIWLGKVVFS
ncbi:MAG: fluoride efflux transporter CrcB [Bacteroidia bacterium]